MTGEELLTMFCRLRGVPEKKIPHVVKMELGRIGLEKFAKKQCGTYRLVLCGVPYVWACHSLMLCRQPNCREVFV